MILVFGSINIDMVVPVANLPRAGETVLGPSYRLVPGGKGANQALAAARAGSRVRLFGRVGRDGFADLALAELKRADVDLGGVARDELPTGCALIPVERSGQNLIIVASGANTATVESQVPDDLLGEGTVAVLQMEVPAAESWALAERARKRGARILLNAAPAGPIPEKVLAQLDWLVVNEHEAITVAGRLGLAHDDPRSAGRAIATTCGTTAIVTLGGTGALAFGPGGAWRIGAMRLKPVDTTAAGDAFVGAFAAAMDAGESLPAALHRASVAGGLACLAEGAQPSLPTKAAIEAHLAELAPPQAMSAG